MGIQRIQGRPFMLLCLLAMCLSLTLLGGCQENQSNRSGLRPSQEKSISKEELSVALNDLAEYFIAKTKQASEELDQRIPSAKNRKLTLLWRLRSSQALFVLSAQEDALAALVDTWTFCVRMSDFFEHGKGSELFGAHQDLALEAMMDVEQEAERIARLFLDEDKYEKSKTFIHSFASRNPILGAYSSNLIYVSKSTRGETNALTDILSLPMAPFRALEGVDNGAVAIHRFTDTANRITDVFELMPESLRWQMLLFLFEIEETDMVQQVLGNMDTFAENSTRLADTADQLPQKLREQASELIEEIDQKQANLQVTLTKAEQTAAAVDKAIVQVDTAAATLDDTAQSVTETAKAWQATVQAVREMVEAFSSKKEEKPRPEPVEPAKPFDIKEYQATIEAATAAAEQMLALVVEVNRTVESPHVTRHIDEVNDVATVFVGQTASEMQRLLDSLTWRLGVLILLSFAAAIVYRVIVARVLPLRGSVPSGK